MKERKSSEGKEVGCICEGLEMNAQKSGEFTIVLINTPDYEQTMMRSTPDNGPDYYALEPLY